MHEQYEIFIIDVPYDDGSGSKLRPALLVKTSSQEVFVYKITSKYNNKSQSIRDMYYPIRYIEYANLEKQSYVDIHRMYNLPKNILYQHNPIGELSKRDVTELREFINQYFTKRKP